MKILFVIFLIIHSNFIPTASENWETIKDKKAIDNKIPAIVLVEGLPDRVYKCGGAIIDWLHVLVAAHCVVDANSNVQDPKTFRIVAGDATSSDQSSQQIRYPKAITPHPNYKRETSRNDIAIIRVNRRFNQSPYVNSISLRQGTPKINQQCMVTGWTKPSKARAGDRSLYFQKIDVEIQSGDVCNLKGAKNLLCAAGPTRERTTKILNAGAMDCNEDSGDPLLCNMQLTGIVTLRTSCGLAVQPTEYADVSKYKKWINQIVMRGRKAHRSSASTIFNRNNILIVFVAGFLKFEAV